MRNTDNVETSTTNTTRENHHKPASDNAKTLAERLEQSLDENNLKQVDVSKALKVSKAAVSKWLSGASEPSRQYSDMLAELLNINVDWLCYGEGAKEKLLRDDIFVHPTENCSIDDHYVVVDDSDDLSFLGRLLAKIDTRKKDTVITYAFYETAGGSFIGSIEEMSASNNDVISSDGAVFNTENPSEDIGNMIYSFFGKSPMAKILYKKIPIEVKYFITID
ncbi:helix-turn-helix domain-containing protein [Psychrobacter sp. UBA3480]|uniref:helix-turn-helix domain-containing protein n=1 Tax=Psychrobacter sp. UBA3480 TaxID=1947350 RepID=UPI0025EF9D0B|nr:helix-turn-helix domain-containing protein [Psychrobacter sp. UBA3480]